MNANPSQSPSDARADLARLLPAPAERDLPSDRHRLIQEFVMSQIHTDPSPAEPAARRVPRRRLILASALTAAAAATAAVVVIGAGDSGGPGVGTAPVTASGAGQQILLAAATTAEQTPAASGTYWHVRMVATGSRTPWESWTQPGGRSWVRGAKTEGKVVELVTSLPFRLGGPEVTFDQLQKLPTEPAALQKWVTEFVRNGDVRTSSGKLDAAGQEQAVFDGLLSLVSQLPAPPKVRAAAFAALAGYPDVESTGATKGGQVLLIHVGTRPPARLVVDPATAQIRETNFFVAPDGALVSIGNGSYTLTAEWTDQLSA